MAKRDIAVVGYGETKIELRGGRSSTIWRETYSSRSSGRPVFPRARSTASASRRR